MDLRKLINLVDNKSTPLTEARKKKEKEIPLTVDLPDDFMPDDDGDGEPDAPGNIPGDDSIGGLKQAIGHKIKDLPPTKESIRALEEIEDILTSMNLGGRSGNIGKQLDSVGDKDVHKAKKLLAMYVLNLPISPKQRDVLFKAWREDKLVDIDALQSLGKHTVQDIFPDYNNDENPGVKYIVDDLATVNDVGIGKGEFLLCVMSKRITKAPKGDLLVDGKNKIEVKTADGGEARLMDADSGSAPGYGKAVEDFLDKWNDDINNVTKVLKSGISLQGLMNIGHGIDDARRRKDFWGDVEGILEKIFPGMDLSDIMGPLIIGSIGHAKLAYAETNLAYYISKKSEQGMLFIDLRKSPPTFVYFNSNEELNEAGLRLHAGTVYPVTQDDPRYPYPQMQILPIKGFGSDEPVPAPDKKVAKKAKAGKVDTAEPTAVGADIAPTDIAPTANAPAPTAGKVYGAPNAAPAPLAERRIHRSYGHKPRF